MALTMKFFVENVPVYFPYPFVYEEQYAYMRHLKRAIERKGYAPQHVPLLFSHGAFAGSHCMLEMPTGTSLSPNITTPFECGITPSLQAPARP